MLKNPATTTLGHDLNKWHARTQDLMDQGAHVIALRGAGKANGIEAFAADIATARLVSYIGSLLEQTDVVMMYDGDEDNRLRPTVGAVFGSAADTLRHKANFTAIAAQTETRYAKQAGSGPLKSSGNTLYETYIFPDDTPGGHASLTQSQDLALYPGYEQIIVGPAGPVILDQLSDLNQKAAERPSGAGPLPVTIVATRNNPNIEADLVAALPITTDPQATEKIMARLAQRAKHPYGTLFTDKSDFALSPGDYPHLSFHITRIGA